MTENYNSSPFDEFALNDYKRTIWNNKRFNESFKVSSPAYIDVDPDTEYCVNKYNYRSSEFKSGTELVYAGCSFTYGIGVPDESYIWGNIVADVTGIEASNISMPGASIDYIVDKIFEYFEMYGHPKYLLCLFPDSFRTYVPIDGDFIGGDKFVGGTSSNNNQGFYHANTDNQPSSKFIKLPAFPEEVLSSDFATFTAVRAIRRLEQYCKVANITLAWTTWDVAAFIKPLRLLQKTIYKFDYFFDIEDGMKPFLMKKKVNSPNYEAYFYGTQEAMEFCLKNHDRGKPCDCNQDCHKGSRTRLLKTSNRDWFDKGTDILKGVEFSHPGAHEHIHYAESFLSQIGIYDTVER